MTDTSLDKFVARGTAAARAAFTPSPPLSSSGYFWFETDTSDTYAWSGSAWVKVNTSAAAAVALISRQTLAAAAASVTFSSITQSYVDLVLVATARGDTAATSAAINAQFNGDTAANYDRMDWEASNITGAGANNNGVAVAGTSITLGYMAAASAPSGAADTLEAKIGNYSGTTFQKAVTGSSTLKTANSAAGVFVISSSGWWRSTAAISSIVLKPSAGNFAAGSTFALYGRL